MNPTVSKISVSHKMDHSLEPEIFNGEKYYPLLVSVSYNEKSITLRSKIHHYLAIYQSNVTRICQNDDQLKSLLEKGYFSEQFINKITEGKIFPIHFLLEDECNVVGKILSLQLKENKLNFDSESVNKLYQLFSIEINQLIDARLKQIYREHLKSIFINAINDEDNRALFKTSNFLIHFINWDNKFSSFYESALEIMASEIRFIENSLPVEVRTSIKAFMAFHDQINLLQRFFEKREQGKIATLSYLDWTTGIKDFLFTRFNNYMGEKKAIEYIVSLEGLLESALDQELS